MDLKELNEINTTSLQQYRDLLATCSKEDLTTPMPDGWTVSAVLVHMAFWDQRALVLLNRWQNGSIEFSPNDIDAINDSTKPMCLAIAPGKAVKLFLKTAETIDGEIAGLNPMWAAAVIEVGKNVNLSRAHHRMMHLEDIKKVLGKD